MALSPPFLDVDPGNDGELLAVLEDDGIHYGPPSSPRLPEPALFCPPLGLFTITDGQILPQNHSICLWNWPVLSLGGFRVDMGSYNGQTLRHQLLHRQVLYKMHGPSLGHIL